MTKAYALDTHCHLSEFPKMPGSKAIGSSATIKVICVTGAPAEFLRESERFKNNSNVRVALGAHPLNVHKMRSSEWVLFTKCLMRTEYVGEVGIDGSPAGKNTLAAQEAHFARVVEATARSSKVLTVHSRGAEQQVHDVLVAARSGPVIFHWYSGKSSIADDLVARGDYFSFNARMLASKKGRALLFTIPMERVLAESDAPFASTEKGNSWVADIMEAYSLLAHCWKCGLTDVIIRLHKNWQRLRTSRIVSARQLEANAGSLLGSADDRQLQHRGKSTRDL